MTWKRRTLTALAVCATVAGSPAAALAWAAATHAYVAKHTNVAGGRLTQADLCRRVLGANSPDLFNSVWNDTGQALANVTHTLDPAPNLAPYLVADTAAERALGYGFANHNNAWGSDSTAHTAGRTIGRDVGYVIAKEQVVGAMLAPAIGAALGLPTEVALPFAVAVSHNFVEFAVDFLVAEVDPEIGATLYASAGCYAGEADDAFLLEALGPYYAPILSDDPAAGLAMAKAWIDTVYPEFVQGLGLNGQVLMLPLEQAKPLIAHQLAVEGAGFLAYQYPGLFDPPPPHELLEALAGAGVDVAMAVCAPDFLGELEATIGWVNGRMSSSGVKP